MLVVSSFTAFWWEDSLDFSLFEDQRFACWGLTNMIPFILYAAILPPANTIYVVHTGFSFFFLGLLEA